MDKTQKRKMIFDDIPGPNENRFVYLNHFPEVIAKFHKTEAPNFERYSMRDMHKVRSNIASIHHFHA